MNISPKNARYLWALSVCFLTFCIGLIHHKWFYPLQFHGDAASMHVLAKAIVDEGSLLPKDFSYGNQLIFLRSSPFIAFSQIIGTKGYDAFALGSSLGVAFWGVTIFAFLNFLFASIKQSVLFTLCLLVPFGYWDSDFILGQQSHLSNAVLSLGMIILAYKYLTDSRYSYLLLSCLCLFIISAEAPIRGLLVLAPLSIAIILTANHRSKTFLAPASMLLTFLLAFLSNKYLLIYRPISLNYFNSLKFKSSGEMLENLGRTTSETIESISSLNNLSGTGLSLLGIISFSLGLYLLVSYSYFVFAGASIMRDAIKTKFSNFSPQKSSLPDDGSNFLHLTGFAGLLFGALAVAGLNPDSSRHYLWAIFIFKLIILATLYKNLGKYIPKISAAFLTIAFAFFASTWFASLIQLNWNVNNAIKSRNHPQAIQDIQKIVEETGISNIYGEDYWRMMPLNSIIENLNAQALLLDGTTIRPYSWLTRPSWACADKNVLYYLKDGAVDKSIEEHLKISHGNIILSGTGYDLWVGPQVWNHPDMAECQYSVIFFNNKTLSSLPSEVGFTENGVRIADGRAGFLLFGPYKPIKSGTYELTVRGSSKLSKGSYIDVVSGGGTVEHARFGIPDLDNDFLLNKGLLTISKDISDIEIRVWTGGGDILSVTGYELTPKK